MLMGVVPGVSAALAPPDVPTPAGAEALADDIRARFSSAMDAPLPSFRVAIREWEAGEPRSYLVRVEVYNLAFGWTARTGYVIAGCWEPGSGFAGGWVVDEVAIADIRAQFDSITACP
jgi:hypothetical protein